MPVHMRAFSLLKPPSSSSSLTAPSLSLSLLSISKEEAGGVYLTCVAAHALQGPQRNKMKSILLPVICLFRLYHPPFSPTIDACTRFWRILQADFATHTHTTCGRGLAFPCGHMLMSHPSSSLTSHPSLPPSPLSSFLCQNKTLLYNFSLFWFCARCVACFAPHWLTKLHGILRFISNTVRTSFTDVGGCLRFRFVPRHIATFAFSLLHGGGWQRAPYCHRAALWDV